MAKKKISKKDLRVVEALLFASEKVLTQAKLNVCFDDGTAPALPSVVETLPLKKWQVASDSPLLPSTLRGFVSSLQG